MDEFFNQIEKGFADCQGDSAFRMDRDRPYNGQPHTDCGERGKTLVEGLTMRDISDVDLNEGNKRLKEKYSADVSYLNKMCNEQLKDYQESLFKAGMVVMKDGKVVNLEDFFITKESNDSTGG